VTTFGYQLAEPKLSLDEISSRLRSLSPEITWCHRFDFDDSLSTITSIQEPYYTKAKGLKIIGQCIMESLPFITKKRNIEELNVLDLACAEGGHSIAFAAAGAKHVLGVEGRRLYVDRATFIAEAYGLNNVEFRMGDVRHALPNTFGRHDLVLFLGILHHLHSSVFLDMLKRLRSITDDTLVLYTHTSETGCERKFGARLTDEFEIEGGYLGRNYQEHPEGSTQLERERRVRNSLDNTTSFWARENSLIKALKDVGFCNVNRIMHPNPFGNPAGDFRVLYTCR
jgi:hypothetical protein